MLTVLDHIAAGSVAIGLKAYGTSEGANKGWDSRGRGQKALDKAGFKMRARHGAGVMRWTAKTKEKDGQTTHHTIDIQEHGPWRHTKGPIGTDIAQGRVHGKNADALAQHLNSGKWKSSFRNEGHKTEWMDVME